MTLAIGRECGEGSKIGHNCQRIVLKHEGWGVKNSEKMPTSFMDGPISNDLDPVPWSLSKKKTKAKKVYEERRQV